MLTNDAPTAGLPFRQNSTPHRVKKPRKIRSFYGDLATRDGAFYDAGPHMHRTLILGVAYIQRGSESSHLLLIIRRQRCRISAKTPDYYPRFRGISRRGFWSKSGSAVCVRDFNFVVAADHWIFSFLSFPFPSVFFLDIGSFNPWHEGHLRS